MATRIHVLIARAAERAVILRRGPTKQVQMLLWHTANDRIEPGQWLEGRIYEHRCDLSPNGQLLVYFAAKHKPPIPAWTAVSRPPYFTALALWPNDGTWGGGGTFESNRRLLLNHRSTHHALAEGFSIPKAFEVASLGPTAGRGEDDPLSSVIMHRNGWTHAGVGTSQRGRSDDDASWIVDPPDVWERHHPHRNKAHRVRLRRSLTAVHVENGPWYRFSYELVVDERVLPVEGADWADFDARGDLLFAVEGVLHRAPHGDRVDRSQAVADLREQQFEPLEPPDEALQWP